MPPTFTLTTLQEIATDENVCDAVREAVLPNWQAAFAKRDADCAPGYIGSVCYHLDVPALTKALRPYGFERADFEKQVRWLNRERYSRPVQLVTTSAEEEEIGIYRVAAKGLASHSFTGQLDLPYAEFAHVNLMDSDNYWIIKDLKISPLPTEMPHMLKITIASLVFEGGGKRTLVVNGRNGEYAIYNGDLFARPMLMDVPDAVTTEVLGEVVDGVMDGVMPEKSEEFELRLVEAVGPASRGSGSGSGSGARAAAAMRGSNG